MNEHRPFHVHDADAPGALSSADAARAALADFDSNAQSFFVSLRPEPQQMPLDFLVHVGLLPPEQLGVTRTLGGDTMEVARARADALAIECARCALLERRKLALRTARAAEAFWARWAPPAAPACRRTMSLAAWT